MDNLWITSLPRSSPRKVIHNFWPSLGIKCQFIHRLSTKLLTLSRKTRKTCGKLSTYPQERAAKRQVIHIIHNFSTKLSPKLSTQASGKCGKLSTYPQERAAKRQVIHIIHNFSTKLSPKLSTQAVGVDESSAVRPVAIIQRLNILWSKVRYPQFMGVIHKIIHNLLAIR